MKVVLDTNVLLSGVFTRGLCEAVLDACVDEPGLDIVLSEYILDEFARHAGGKFAAPADDVKEAVDFLRRSAEIVRPAELPLDVCKDADDVPVLGTAVAAGAEVLVTGDAELLALKRVQAVAIMSPREFFDRLQ